MPSYKIHSIKDSEKLSFIIDWENEQSVNQRLSKEGHIILSVEKTKLPSGKLFSFEGKKRDGSFVDGKIAADDIFVAYDMLTREYKYILTQLYPDTIQDQKERTRIFSELQLYISEKVVKKVEKKSDTSQEQLNAYKSLLQKLSSILSQYGSPEVQSLTTELKKLEQNNNAITILQALKDTMKKLSQKREERVLLKQLKPLMREVGIFVPPDMYFSIIGFFKRFFKAIDPLVHTKKTQKKIQSPKIISYQDEYNQIHNNTHIHTFLRKKFRSHMTNALHNESQKYYFYTLLRENKLVSFLRKAVFVDHSLIEIILMIVVFLFLSTLLFWFYSSVFVTTPVLIIFLLLIIVSLVIRSDTV